MLVYLRDSNYLLYVLWTNGAAELQEVWLAGQACLFNDCDKYINYKLLLFVSHLDSFWISMEGYLGAPWVRTGSGILFFWQNCRSMGGARYNNTL